MDDFKTIRKRLHVFKNNDSIGSMNIPIHIDEEKDIHFVLYFWVASHDKLRVRIKISKDVIQQKEEIDRIMDEVSDIFEDVGYEVPSNFTEEERSIAYVTYQTEIPNPLA